jgi:general L-amino acid transport system permease protein
MNAATQPPPPAARPLWGRLALQLAIGWLLILLLGWLAHNASRNLAARGIAGGFGFLEQTAGFSISEGLLPYEPADSYLRAVAAGVANTVRAAVPALVLATVLGLLLGIAATARHPLVRGAVRIYVDVVRNIPLLVQVLLWYFMLTSLLPDVDHPLAMGPLGFLSKAGLALPGPVYDSAAGWHWSAPQPGMFGIDGGLALTPEFLALVGALGLYAAYCAEIVRAGLQAVPRGQWHAASALGMRRGQQLRLIVLPQALRVIIPPYTNLALSTIKNSSLAVAIGYPDVVMVANTAMSQTGQAIECVTIIAVVYLAINLLTSLALNAFNRRSAFITR